MVDYKKIMKGVLFFFAGFFLIIILNYLIPALTEALSTIYNNSDITGIIWLMAIIIYVSAGVIIPLIFIYQGLTTEKEPNPMVNIPIVIIGFILGIVLTIKAWYMVTSIATLTTDPFITGVYWIGITITRISIMVITPIYVIVKETEII